MKCIRSYETIENTCTYNTRNYNKTHRNRKEKNVWCDEEKGKNSC